MDHEREQTCSQELRNSLCERLRQAQSEHEESSRSLHSMIEHRRQLEQHQSDATLETENYVSELASVKLETSHAEEQIQLAENGCRLAEACLQDSEPKYEEESTSAALGMQLLRQEVAEYRESRQIDVKNARQQVRTRVTRREDALRRMTVTHENNEGVWVQKLTQSEARVSKLEQEVQQLRQTRRELPVRTSTLEMECAGLLGQIADVERRCEVTEENERKRRLEMVTLLVKHEELRGRRETLERECAAIEN